MVIGRSLNNVLTSLKIEYSDDDLHFNTTEISTVDNFNFNINHILDSCNSVNVNNYNCLFVTKPQLISDSISINKTTQSIYTGVLSSNNGIYNYTTSAFSHTTSITQDHLFEIYINNNTYECEIYKQLNDGNCVKLQLSTSSPYVQIASGTMYGKMYNNIIHFINYNNIKCVINYKSNNNNLNTSNMQYGSLSGDVAKVYDNESNNFLIDIQYSNYIDNTYKCNVLAFNNQKTYNNTTCLTGYWDTHNHNNVTTLHTGNNQEYGNTHIYTTQEFYTADYSISPGINKVTAPNNLYPFVKIDINDTNFANVGAKGSHTPATADKIYIDRYPNHPDNTILLCTWLSSNGVDSIWVDRYYNPALYDKVQILNMQTDTTLNGIYSQDLHLLQYGFFDKQSDVYITPELKFDYYHITNTDLHDYVAQLDSTYVSGISFKNISNADLFTTNYINLTGGIYGYASVNTLLNNNFTISFDANTYDWYNNAFYDIFTSNSNNCGIRIYKENQLTPILITYSTSSIVLLNTRFEIIDAIYTDDLIQNAYIHKNTQYIIAQLKSDNNVSYVNVYTLFGALITTYSGTQNIISYVSENDNKLYLTHTSISAFSNTHLVSAIDLDSFECLLIDAPLGDIMISSTITLSAMVYEDNKLYYIDGNYNNIGYVNNLGVLYIDPNARRAINITPSNNNPEAADDRLKIKYCKAADGKITSNKAQTFISVHTNTHIDEYGFTVYDCVPVLDYKVYGEMLYFVTSSNIYTCDITKTNIRGYKLPVVGDDVSVCITSEIENTQFISKQYVLITDKQANKTHVYQFESGDFIFICDLDATINNANLKHLTPLVITPPTHDISLELAFKLSNNTTTSFNIYNKRFKKILPQILPGKHTFTLCVDTIQNTCKLYVDDSLHTQIDLVSNNNLQFSYDITQNSIILGNTLLYNGGNLANYTNNSNWIAQDIEMGEVYVFNTALSHDDVIINATKDIPSPNITLQLPCGQRNKISQIKSYSKQTTPGYKSTHFDVIIKNLRLSKENQAILTQAVGNFIKTQLPITTELDNIQYEDY